MSKVYAVKVGRETGLFNTWAECEKQIKGFSGAQYKSFANLNQAVFYLATPDQINNAPTFECEEDLAAYLLKLINKQDNTEARALASAVVIPAAPVVIKKELINSAPEIKINSNLINSKECIHIHVDGAFRDGIYAWSFVAHINNEVIYEASGTSNNPEFAQFNNIAGELTAAMRAVKWAKDNQYNSCVVYHDLQGTGYWARGEWKRNNICTQKFNSFIAPYVNSNFVTFNWVKGHNGDPMNNRADELCTKALNNQ